jgi:hypothetical protein
MAGDRRKKNRESGSQEQEDGQGENAKTEPWSRTRRWSGSRRGNMAITHARFGGVPWPPAGGSGSLHRSRPLPIHTDQVWSLGQGDGQTLGLPAL